MATSIRWTLTFYVQWDSQPSETHSSHPPTSYDAFKPFLIPISKSTCKLHNHLNMPMMRRSAPRTVRAKRTTARPSLKTRLLGGRKNARRAPATTTTTTTTTRTTRTTGHGATAAPVHHHKRHASMGDKVSGMMMKLRGSLTRRPGLKVCACLVVVLGIF